MLPVGGDDDVAAADAHGLGAGAGVDAYHVEPVWDVVILRGLCGHGPDRDAQGRAAEHAPVAYERVGHLLDGLDGDGEAYAVYARAGVGRDELHARDAHDLAVHVQKRPAGVALVDGDVGLDERHGMVRVAYVAAEGAYYAVRHRAAQLGAERVAYGGDGLAHGHRVAAELRGREADGLNLYDGDVAGGVRAHEAGLILPVIPERHRGADRALEHVAVREDIAVFGHDDAGAPEVFARLHDGGYGHDGGAAALIHLGELERALRRPRSERELDARACLGAGHAVRPRGGPALVEVFLEELLHALPALGRELLAQHGQQGVHAA